MGSAMPWSELRVPLYVVLLLMSVRRLTACGVPWGISPGDASSNYPGGQWTDVRDRRHTIHVCTQMDPAACFAAPWCVSDRQVS
jgi:hypothetical protein